MPSTFPQLPFSVIGSLNGVHMFGQNLEVQLSSARTEDTTVVWKSFHDRSPSGSVRRGLGPVEDDLKGLPALQGQLLPSLISEFLWMRSGLCSRRM